MVYFIFELSIQHIPVKHELDSRHVILPQMNYKF